MALSLSPARADLTVTPAPDGVPREHRPGFFERLFGPPPPESRAHLRRVQRTYTVVYPDGRRVRYVTPPYTVVYPNGVTPPQGDAVAQYDSRGVQHLQIPVNPASGSPVVSDAPEPAISSSYAADQSSVTGNYYPAEPARRMVQPSPRTIAPQENSDEATSSSSVTQAKPRNSTSARKPSSHSPSGTNLTAASGLTAYEDDIALGKDHAFDANAQKPADLPSPKNQKESAATPKPPVKNYPMGTQSTKAGFVKSPYEPFNELDATGLTRGSLAKDPTTGKIFMVP